MRQVIPNHNDDLRVYHFFIDRQSDTESFTIINSPVVAFKEDDNLNQIKREPLTCFPHNNRSSEVLSLLIEFNDVGQIMILYDYQNNQYVKSRPQLLLLIEEITGERASITGDLHYFIKNAFPDI